MAFEVVPASVPVSQEDRLRAASVPASELPTLTESQAAEVRHFSLNEEEYKRRRILTGNFARTRQELQGRAFGMFVEEVLQSLRAGWTVMSVSRCGTPRGWTITVRNSEHGSVEFQCSLEVVEAVVKGTASPEELENLRRNIVDELGLQVRLGATA